MANSNPDLNEIKKNIREQEKLIKNMEEDVAFPFEIESTYTLENKKKEYDEQWYGYECKPYDTDRDICMDAKKYANIYGEQLKALEKKNEENQEKLDKYNKAQTELNRLKELAQPSKDGGRKLRRRRRRRTRKGAKKSKKRRRKRRTKKRKAAKKSRRRRR